MVKSMCTPGTSQVDNEMGLAQLFRARIISLFLLLLCDMSF